MGADIMECRSGILQHHPGPCLETLMELHEKRAERPLLQLVVEFYQARSVLLKHALRPSLPHSPMITYDTVVDLAGCGLLSLAFGVLSFMQCFALGCPCSTDTASAFESGSVQFPTHVYSPEPTRP